MSNPHLLTAAEVAEQLCMSTGSVYRLAASGAIPSYAVGPKLRGRRFDLDEVRAALHRPMRQLVSVA